MSFIHAHPHCKFCGDCLTQVDARGRFDTEMCTCFQAPLCGSCWEKYGRCLRCYASEKRLYLDGRAWLGTPN